MLIIYGSMLCKDCAACRQELDKAGVAYDYRDFSQELGNLKEFLRIRDENPMFAAVKDNGAIGIPCIVKPDGQMTLDWQEFL